MNLFYCYFEPVYAIKFRPKLLSKPIANAIDLGLECSTGALPLAAIILATTGLHLRRVGVTLDQGIADVTKNLQIVYRIGSTMIL